MNYIGLNYCGAPLQVILCFELPYGNYRDCGSQGGRKVASGSASNIVELSANQTAKKEGIET